MPKAEESVPLFREVQTLEGLLIREEEKDWIERRQAEPSPRPTVLYLGCNILRTPHLAQTVTALFRRMGEDFVALGGPAFCCGAPFRTEGEKDRGRPWGEKLASHFERFQPQRVVMWCPGCLHYYERVLALSGPFRLQHVTEFLAENRDRLTLAPIPATRVALHYHSGSPAAERHATAARALLAAVPGVELLEIGTSVTWGRNCSGILRDGMGQEAWQALITPFFQKAAALGADIFATLYHGCQRMYAGYEEGFPFAIEHYLSVVARALGIAYPDRYKKYLLWKDRDRILEDASPCMKVNHVKADLAAAVVEHVFVNDRGL